MENKDLGYFIKWLIINKKVKNKIEFATIADINRGHLYKMLKINGDLTDFMIGKILTAFGAEYKQFLQEEVTETMDSSSVSEETTTYNSCKKCAAKDAELRQLKNRVAELEEIVQLYRENKRQNEEGKRAV